MLKIHHNVVRTLKHSITQQFRSAFFHKYLNNAQQLTKPYVRPKWTDLLFELSEAMISTSSHFQNDMSFLSSGNPGSLARWLHALCLSAASVVLTPGSMFYHGLVFNGSRLKEWFWSMKGKTKTGVLSPACPLGEELGGGGWVLPQHVGLVPVRAEMPSTDFHFNLAVSV